MIVPGTRITTSCVPLVSAQNSGSSPAIRAQLNLLSPREGVCAGPSFEAGSSIRWSISGASFELHSEVCATCRRADVEQRWKASVVYLSRSRLRWAQQMTNRWNRQNQTDVVITSPSHVSGADSARYSSSAVSAGAPSPPARPSSNTARAAVSRASRPEVI
jgi:hypothetical protein